MIGIIAPHVFVRNIMMRFRMMMTRCVMDQKRNDHRVNYISKCFLNIQGESYSGLLENISTTGALIKMNDAVPQTIQCGNECVLSALLLIPVKCAGKILRIESTQIALLFLGQ